MSEPETHKGENDHSLYMKNTQRNASFHNGQESNQILSPSSASSLPQTPRKTKALNMELTLGRSKVIFLRLVGDFSYG